MHSRAEKFKIDHSPTRSLTVLKGSLKMDKVTSKAKEFFIVGIGASAGGLESFRDLLSHLPVDSGMAFIFVQHLNPQHVSQLTEIISKSTAMAVMEVENNTLVEPNRVFIIPPNKKMIISKGVLKLAPKNGEMAHPSVIDVFFNSLAEDRKNHAIGIILSGMGADGAIGLTKIRAEGGITFAQDKSAKYDGMPQQAIATDSVDFILSPEKIAKQLIRISQHPDIDYGKSSDSSGAHLPSETTENNMDDNLTKLLILIRKTTGIDFTHYKQNTLKRRISRRMAIRKIEKLSDYVQFLEVHPSELKALSHDLLIKVTSFFRDPEVFQELKNVVFPSILNARKAKADSATPIKVWVPGCSTGEEVYSIAIALLEFLDSHTPIPIQLFGTDVSEVAIEKARTGFYSENEVSSVLPERLKRFFVRKDDGYRLNKSVRDICVFAEQDVTNDPPFSALDLISCRNLLIYFESSLQEKVIPLFHYGLKPTGYLVLGSAEALGSFGHLFAPIGKKHKIYSKKLAIRQNYFHFSKKDGKENFISEPRIESRDRPILNHTDFHKEVERAIIEKLAPAGVVINEEREVIQFRGHTGDYLEPAPGRVTYNLMKMARASLRGDLHTTIQEVIKHDIPMRKGGIRLKTNGHLIPVSIEVLPLKIADSKERHFLILFEKGIQKKTKRIRATSESQKSEVDHLKQELQATQDYLQSVVDKEQTLNEELKTTNEEILSTNEEFQSTNEELETAKEELQSTNEELTTLNDELQNRNHLLTELNNDLDNLLVSVKLPLLLLDKDLQLRRFTPLAEKLFKLMPADIGRSINDIRHPFDIPFDQVVTKVIQSDSPYEQDMQDEQGHWFTLWIRPYVTGDQKSSGVVVVLHDVDTLKRTHHFSNAIIKTMKAPLLVLDSTFRITFANQCFYETFKVTPEQTEKALIYELGTGQWNVPKLRYLLEEILPKHIQFDNFEVSVEFPNIGKRTMLLNARRLEQGPKEAGKILLVLEDISERMEAEQKLAKISTDLLIANKDLEQFACMASHDLQEPLRTMSTYMELVMKRYQSALDKEGRKLITQATAAAQRMQILVKDLLRFSQTTTEVAKSEATNCSEVVTEIVAGLGPLIKETETKITYETLPTIMTDRVLLGQVFQNLITNAIKFRGSSPSQVRISAHQNEKEWVFSVKDNGIGIEKKYADRIFLVFRRLHSREEYPGSGLGLAMCKKIVDRCGGRIWFDSKVGNGSTFYFALPMPHLDEKQKLKGARILIADDAEDTPGLIGDLLSENGAMVDFAKNGEEASKMVRQNQTYDIILMDIQMPRCDGIEATSLIRKGGYEGIIIAFTGHSRGDDKNYYSKLGFDDYAEKNERIAETMQLVEKYWLDRNKMASPGGFEPPLPP